jgi:hypothetical protein
MMDEKVGVLDSYHLGEALKPSARKLGERCGSAAVAMLAKRFEQCIGTPDEDRYSYIWRSAIEDHEQDAHKDSFRTVLVDALRDAALGATGTQTEDALGSARTLLQSPFPTLVRVGIYMCGEHYSTLGRTFWECVKSDWLLAPAYWHELFWFIKKAFPRFSASERARFLALVDQSQGEWTEEALRDELDETHRRDLLYPAVGLGDADVDARYKDLVARRGPVREHPDFHSYTTSGWVGERSPVTSDTLVGMADADLMALLNDFVPDSRAWDGPTYRGLASTLSAAVRASEDGFASRIKLFADSARPYQHGLLRGLKERWADDKHVIDWPAALSLMRSIAAAPAFKKDLDAKPVEGWEPSVHWVVGDISDLVKAGSSVDRQLSPELLLKGLEILQLVLSVTKPDDASESKDAVSHAINSARGRALETVINVALALRRQEAASGQHGGRVWALVAPILDAELSSSESGRNADFAALAGMYCANLHYLNSHWVEENFDRLFSTSSDSAWRCAAQGFAYQRYLYDWLFRKLNGNGHLRKMVFAEGLPDSVAEKALQFLGLAYLEGMEKLTGEGLLAELIVALKTEQLSQLCWFFWTLRGGQERAASRSALILAFWARIAEAIRARGESRAELQSALGLLAVFIEELTPTTLQMWVEAAPHAQVRHHGYILVEHMARLASRNPAAIADVFRSALTGFLPDYQAEEVIRCVKALADAGRVDDAEWICNEYARRGSTLLKEPYEALRASQRALPTERNNGH